MKKAKKKALALILALGLAAAGLAGLQYYYDHVKPPDISPRQVVERYFEALKLQDYEKALTLVSRRHYHDSFNQFVDRVKLYAPDMGLEITGETIKNDKAAVDMDIIVPMAFGPHKARTSMALARDKREWKIIHP